MARVSFSLLLMGLMGCELVVSFDRSRIVEDGGVDAGEVEDDAGSDEEDAGEEDDGGPPEDGGPLEDGGPFDGGPEVDAGPEADAGPEVDAGPESDAGPLDGGADADAGPECTGAGDCDDSVDCTVDSCDSMMCVNTPDDGMCDDSDDCTADMCDMVAGCMNEVLCAVDVTGLMLDDLTTVVVVPSVDAVEDGFVVVWDDDGGAPDMVLGSASVSAGTTSDVEVELVRPVTDGETLHVALHVDAGTIGTFEMGTDPIEQLDSMDVLETLTATVPAGTPDLEVTVSGLSTSDYTFSAGRPSTFTLPSGTDPSFELLRGFRYRVVNTTPGAHPFELITDGSPDVVQLSQDAAGDLEADGDVD